MNNAQTVEIRSRRVLRNTVLNLLGSLLPIGPGVWAIPHLIKGLGVGRFGALSLAWIILSYFSLFDFGLGRATTKFVSEAIGNGKKNDIPALIWASAWIQLCLGGVGAMIMIAATPLVVGRILNIPQDLRPESLRLFYIMSLAIPVGIWSVCFRGVLEAVQRFDMVNAVKIPLNCGIFVMPLLGLRLGYGLSGVAVILVAMQVAGSCAYLLLCFRVFPELRLARSFQRKLLKPLLVYGGWVTGYNVIIPMTMYLDRLIIGALQPIGMLTYYVVPYDAISRVQILPASLSTSLFPVFSNLGMERKENSGELCTRSLKYLILVMGPLTLVLVLLAKDILRLWLGVEFAAESTLIFQILAIGFLLNALSWPPTTALLAVGRPDLVTKCYALLLVLQAGLAWTMIHKFGLVGAALAVALLGTLQACFFFFLYWRVMSFTFSGFRQSGLIPGLLTSGSLIVVLGCSILLGSQSGFNLILLVIGLTALFLLIGWRYVLNSAELAELRAGFLLMLGREGESK
jgi:O-antigen/teichoic acid export membrane protein